MKIGLRITTYDLVRRLSEIARDAVEQRPTVQKSPRSSVAGRPTEQSSGTRRVER